MDPVAQRHLADRLEGARRMTDLGGPFVTGESMRSTLASYGGALEAFRAMGAMDDEERQDWFDRMLVALGQEVPEPLPPDPPGRFTARAIFIGAPGERPPMPEPPVPAGSLVRAIVVPGGSWEFADGRFQILSVEVYEHAVSVNWREHPLIDPELAHAEELELAERDLDGLPDGERAQRREAVLRRLRIGSQPIETIEDDVGTTYTRTSGGSGGGMDSRRGHQDFAPGPPPEARRLVVRWQGQPVEVPLHDER